METIETHYLIYILLSFPLTIYIIMIFNYRYIKSKRDENEAVYIDEDAAHELSENGINLFM